MLVLLGLIVMSLVFFGWIEILLMERNCEVMLSSFCVSCWFLVIRFRSSIKARLLVRL